MCRELDKPINRVCRHITKNLPGFPTNLLYASSPGLALKRLSDEIQLRKLAMVNRGLTYTPASPLPRTGSYSAQLGSMDYNHSPTKPKPSPTPQTTKDGATRYWSD